MTARTICRTKWIPAPSVPALVPALAASAIAALTILSAAPAVAGCQEDMAGLMGPRQSMMIALNKMTGGGKGKLDPIAACPKLKALAAQEAKISAYLEKNKDWCNVPDKYLEDSKAGHAKTAGFAAKACQVAAQVVKMKAQAAQQQAQGGQQAQKLPTGPL